MARVVITIEDAEDGVEIAADFQPELPEELGDDDLDQLTDAQLFALEMLEYVSEQEEGEDAEDDAPA